MQKLIFSLLIFHLVVYMSHAQHDAFSGAYTNAASNLGLRLKAVGNEYHGLIQSAQGSFALQAQVNGEQLLGKIYRQADVVDFTLSKMPGGLSMASVGYTEVFYLISSQHQLDGVDLTAYFKKGEKNTSPEPAAHEKAYDHPALLQMIAGSQLVFYTRTSYANDNTASAMTYINFCPNGQFYVQTEGSFSVEGYGGNAHGANQSTNSGSWQLVTYQGTPSVKLVYANGAQQVNPIDEERLQQGRWRVGNTQFAFLRGKAVCR